LTSIPQASTTVLIYGVAALDTWFDTVGYGPGLGIPNIWDLTRRAAGTIVGVNPWVMHRDQEVFGEDVETFRPERWLERDRSDMDRFFFAFGSGARVCLGRNISWVEMNKLVPTLFSKFDLQLANPEASWKETCW
jgi:cytochrome P450